LDEPSIRLVAKVAGWLLLAVIVGYARQWWLVALGLVGLTAAVEFAQLFVPGRHARLKDLVIDAGAVCLGVAIVWSTDFAASLLRSRQSRQSSKS
jgi:VanZ family protein